MVPSSIAKHICMLQLPQRLSMLQLPVSGCRFGNSHTAHVNIGWCRAGQCLHAYTLSHTERHTPACVQLYNTRECLLSPWVNPLNPARIAYLAPRPQNNLHELWALLNFLLPEVFSSSEKFEEWFSMGDGGKEKEAEVVQQLHKVGRDWVVGSGRAGWQDDCWQRVTGGVCVAGLCISMTQKADMTPGM